MTTPTPDRYGVVGYPVSHSLSPVIHKLFARQTRQQLEYERLEVHPDDFENAVRAFADCGGKGLNVTVPHKLAAVQVAVELSDRAEAAGAVNTLAFRQDGVLGDNTDGAGLLRDLQVNLGLSLAGSAILVLGAGGATRGILGPLLAAKPARVVIANRTLHNAIKLAHRFSSSGQVSACSFEDLDRSRAWSLVINATSAGLRGGTAPCPPSAINEETVCYDLSYGSKPTPFCLWANSQGAKRAESGIGMLVEQAAESFALWRGIRPDTAPVLRELSAA